MSQFIIATNNASVLQRNAITEYVKSKRWGFWHHFEDFWMIATVYYGDADYDSTTPQQIWSELSNNPVIGKATNIIIIRLPENGRPMTHYGYGPNVGWEWMKRYWGPVG